MEEIDSVLVVGRYKIQFAGSEPVYFHISEDVATALTFKIIFRCTW